MGSSCSIDQLPIPGKRGEFPTIKILVEAHKRGLDRNKFNLVGRLDLMKIKISEVRQIVIAQWKPKGVCRIIPVGKGYFTIFLDNEEDRNNIWMGGLGFEFWEVDSLVALGRTMGTPIHVDRTQNDFGYFAKVLVDIDLTEPIPNKVLVELEDGDFWQRVELGALPKFCPHCKMVGHNLSECRGVRAQVQRKEDVKDKRNQEEARKGIGSFEAGTKEGITSSSRTEGKDHTEFVSGTPINQIIKETNSILLNKDENWADMVEDEERDEACVAQVGGNSTKKAKRGTKNKRATGGQHLTVLCNGAIIYAVHASVFKTVRRGLWKDFIDVSKLNLPWLVLGDFNIIRLQTEKFGGSGPTLSSINEFNDCLDECELLESVTLGMKLTWCNGQSGGARISRRLDRALYNSKWASSFDGWKVKALARENSDHSTLVGGQNYIPKPTNIPFHFLKCWIEILGFNELVKSFWEKVHDGNPLIKLMKKLQRLKAEIKIWKTEAIGGLKAAISKCSANLESLHSLIEFSDDGDLIKAAMNKENELNQLMKKENSIWHQKSRLQWLTDGERNSAFFHSMHKIKSTKNNITEVVTADGSSITDVNDIQSHIIISKLGVSTRARPAPCIKSRRWILPWYEEIKLNCGSSTMGNPGKVGLGVIARTHTGEVLGVRTKGMGIMNTLEAECFAIMEALSWAIEKGWKKV
ncbi:hypothetical protein GIB67_002021 [Kingdonia uniflora]|uniref:RNase H type-1 domain-containing protein n=1 Tax=Kingdonia uniflora TaxID=39325 RepID=A0A7J7MAG0_9MAGN|nr:hypothetical protein GIB67_002021 [Kingdonia uniflora]